MTDDPIILSTAAFGAPVFCVRFRRGRTVHALTELRQLAFPVQFDQIGRGPELDYVSAGPAGITLCGERFGWGTERGPSTQPVTIELDDDRMRCPRCVRLADPVDQRQR